MTGFAVVNLRAGRTMRDWPKIERALTAAYPGVRIAMSRRQGDTANLVRRALEDGHSEIIAVGGDGTVNEAVNGFFDSDGSIAPDAVLAFVTSGTAGDVRRSFGSIPDAAKPGSGRIRAVDVGRISCLSPTGAPVVRHFINIGSFGLSAAIVNTVNRFPFIKLFGSAFAYSALAGAALFTYRSRAVRLRIDGDFDEIASVATVAVANGQYFGGGLRVAPQALIDDGLFDVVIIGGGRHSLSDLKLLRAGEHVQNPAVRVLRGRKVMAAPVAETGGHAVPIEIDGESAGRLPATFEILPRALNLRC